MQLRVAWGGGGEQIWRGKITLSEGTLARPVALGLEPDEPGTMIHQGRTVHIWQRSPRVYDGVDLDVTAPLTARISIELSPAPAAAQGLGEPPPAPTKKELSLAELLDAAVAEPLDDAGNRLIVRRAPGDRLRVKLSRDSLVFAPREEFSLIVSPHLLSLSPSTTLRLRSQLATHGGGREIWSDQQDRRVDAEGEIEPATLRLTLPEEEGVYDLSLTLTRTNFATRLVPAKVLERRTVQLIVIDRRPPVILPNRPPQLVDEIDPTNSRWWERFTQLPTLKAIPGYGQGPLRGGTSRATQRLGESFLELDGSAWQAYPLTVARPGEPHILEIEYPNDLPQTLGISLMEPDAAGKVMPIGIDSGVQVEALPAGAEPALLRHRLICWPRSRSPLVVVVNRRTNQPAALGRIRLLHVGEKLTPSETPAAADQRLAMAYYDRPLFSENFSASEAVDSVTGRTLDDWKTFYDGGRRLVEYLGHAGRNAAVLSVVSEGSAIYPSRLLEPTPKYDTGAFFASGQDPVRKDVLEMLFRLFDQRQLVLVPAVQFHAPLPALEDQLASGAGDTLGLEWTDSQGRTWLQRQGARAGVAPYYNTLDDRVQQAMLDVVAELVDRYGHHPSFGGVAVQLSPEGYAQLPAAEWGLDPVTVRRFLQETRLNVSASDPEQVSAALLGPSRESWLRWRAARLTTLYARMEEVVASQDARARLYLLGTDLLRSQPLADALHPTLPAKGDLPALIDRGLLELGIDVPALAELPGLVLARPQRLTSATSLAAQAVEVAARDSADLDTRLAAVSRGTSLIFHAPQTLRLAALDEAAPFGRGNSYSWFVSQISPSGAAQRRALVHAVATQDTRTFIEGGWLLPMGQEQAVADILDTYRRLPNRPFELVPSSGVNRNEPVTVRKLEQDGRTYLYLANDSPWPVKVRLELDAPGGARVETLGLGPRLPQPQRTAGALSWTVDLQPYDLRGAIFTAPSLTAKYETIGLPDQVPDRLRDQIQQFGQRIAALKTPRPLDSLANASFEAPAGEQPVPGWVHAVGENMQIATTDDAHDGGRSLRLSSTGPVLWVRSDPFPTPSTGRLAVWVWLRVDDANKQPPLRLAVEGRLNGRTYYPFAKVGAGAGVKPLTERWEPYVFQIDDLPVEGMQQLRVGFDLMGPGQVSIDNVQVFDLSFTESEQHELNKIKGLANYYLNNQRFGDCASMLGSYWPQYLSEYIPTTAIPVATRPAAPTASSPPAAGSPPAASPPSAPVQPPPQPPAEAKRPTPLERLRSWIPGSSWF